MKQSLKARARAFLAGLFSSGVEMSEEERLALEAAQSALSSEGDAVADVTARTFPVAVEDPANRARIEALQAQIEGLQAREREERILALTTQGKLTPAAAPHANQLLAADPEAFLAFLDAQGVLASHKPAPTTPSVSGDEARAVTEGGNDASNSQLHHLALARQKAENLTYYDALQAVAIENRELVAASLAAIPAG